jgi:hypothetical protein
VRTQARRIDELERVLRHGSRATSAESPAAVGEADDQAPRLEWIAPARWRSLEPGMSTAEIIAKLGPPTAVRAGADPDQRVLLYTLELDVDAFLSGSVRIENDRAAAIEIPVLR